MMDGINGPGSTGPTDPVRENHNTTKPPSGSPAGAPAVKPDVDVAISQMAQARMDAMMEPAVESSKGEAAWNSKSGSMEVGVGKGEFEWPLNIDQSNTTTNAQFSSQQGWSAGGDVINGVLVDETNAATNIAMGKTAISDNS